MTDTQQSTTDESSKHEFVIQRVYTKDASFEAPNSPESFQTEWKPAVTVDLQTSSSQVLDKFYEVVLTLTITAKIDDKTAFLIEIHQAGIFTIKNYPEDQMDMILGSVCPNIIYPYAREAASDLIVRGGFPNLYLNPINFDALFAKQQAEKGGNTAGKSDSATTESTTVN